MNRIIFTVLAVVALATGAQANNFFYGEQGLSMENEGYRLFVSDNILNTVDKADRGADGLAAYCAGEGDNTAKRIGDIGVIRSDDRLPLNGKAKISYAAACNTYYSVVARLRTADEIRRLWLLFADSATDDYAVETIKKAAINEDVSALIEMRRLNDVSKYIEFFTRNKEWKLTDYTFLSQAFKSRKGKTLSPAYIQFITSLLTGDAEKAIQDINYVDLDNLGSRFIAPGTGDRMRTEGADPRR